MTVNDGRARVVIAGVQPEIDSGRFPVKRTVGEKLVVEADIFADGHDTLSAVVLYRAESEAQWHEVPLRFHANDRWRGEFRVTTLGTYVYTVLAWIDHFSSWRESLRKKVGANQDVTVDLLIGAELLDAAARRATGAAAAQFAQWAGLLRQTSNRPAAIDLALADEMATLVAMYPDRQLAVTYERELRVIVEREKARFSAWYEMFPRSCAPEPGRHGTFKDCEARLPYIATMGFDVLYLPPIHPIGGAFRKGKNHALVAGPDDPGSPWAIGAAEGGHKAIHPELGTLADFLHLVAKAKEWE